jgi:hypothetical protein
MVDRPDDPYIIDDFGNEVFVGRQGSPYDRWERIQKAKDKYVKEMNERRQRDSIPRRSHLPEPTLSEDTIKAQTEAILRQNAQPKRRVDNITVIEFDINDDAPEYINDPEAKANIMEIKRAEGIVKECMLSLKNAISKISNAKALSSYGLKQLNEIRIGFNSLLNGIRAFDDYMDESIQMGDTFKNKMVLLDTLKAYHNGINNLKTAIRNMVIKERQIMSVNGLAESQEIFDSEDALVPTLTGIDSDTSSDLDERQTDLVPTFSGTDEERFYDGMGDIDTDRDLDPMEEEEESQSGFDMPMI